MPLRVMMSGAHMWFRWLNPGTTSSVHAGAAECTDGTRSQFTMSGDDHALIPRPVAKR